VGSKPELGSQCIKIKFLPWEREEGESVEERSNLGGEKRGDERRTRAWVVFPPFCNLMGCEKIAVIPEIRREQQSEQRKEGMRFFEKKH